MVDTLFVVHVADHLVGLGASDVLGFGVDIFIVEMAGFFVLDGEGVEVGGFGLVLDEELAGALVGELAALGTEVSEESAEIHTGGGAEVVDKDTLGAHAAEEDGTLSEEVVAVDADFGGGGFFGDSHCDVACRLNLILHDTLEGVLSLDEAEGEEGGESQKENFFHDDSDF